MTTLVAHLYRRMMTRGRVIGLLALSSVPAAVILLAATAVSRDRRGMIYPEVVTSAGYTFVIAVLILTVGTLRDERDAGTLPYIYMKPVPRTAFAAGSIAGGVVTAATIGMGAWAAALGAAAVTGADLTHAVAGLSLFLAAAIGYAGLFVPLGYLAPRSLLFGLGYVVVLESIVAPLVDGVAQLSIWRIATSIYADLVPEFPDTVADFALGPVVPGVGGGVAKIVVVLVLGWGVLTWALRARDAI